MLVHHRLLPPGWAASPSQVTSKEICHVALTVSRYPFILLLRTCLQRFLETNLCSVTDLDVLYKYLVETQPCSFEDPRFLLVLPLFSIRQ